MADFAELGATVTDHLTEKHFDSVYDKVNERINKKKRHQNQPQPTFSQAGARDSALSSASTRRHRNQLPSPERPSAYEETIVRDLSPERSETSERVLRAYEAERDDPRRRPESVLSPPRGHKNMSTYVPYQSGGGGGGGGGSGYAPRPRSQPARSRYDDDDDGDSDYDEREGRRYRSGGRGYRDDDDYDREVIETERYKGVSTALVPARPHDSRRDDGYSSRHDPYGAGAVTQYRRSNNDLTTDVSRRTRDRGRDDRDRSYSRSRSGSRDGERGEGIKGKLDEFFDTSPQGLGVGLAGAVIGGLAGRQFGKQHKQRDIILGAIVGGLGANAAETKYRDWKEDKEERKDRYEQRYDGRARSSVR